MTPLVGTVTVFTMLAQSIIDESWVKMIVQLGVAGLWLWWLTKHLKDQTDRDDKRHLENLTQGKHHALAMERLVLTVYDVLDQLTDQYPHAKERVREAIRKDATTAIEELKNS